MSEANVIPAKTGIQKEANVISATAGIQETVPTTARFTARIPTQQEL
jgi:hypothetical protein